MAKLVNAHDSKSCGKPCGFESHYRHTMQCGVAQKNINSFLRETLKGNELRKTYYHLKKCPKCKEVLLDEFSFYTTFNDLDKDLDFNYERNLEKLMSDIEEKIKSRDSVLTSRFIIASIFICFIFLLILIIALRLMYR